MGNNHSKRIFTALLALVLVLVVFPAPAKAAATCPCCGENLSDINWSVLPNVKSLPAGHYRLTGNTTLKQQYTSSGKATVDLNGHRLTALENARAFYVYSNTLTILDTVGTGTIVGNGTGTASGGLVRVGKGAVLNLYGGTISGGKVATDCVGGNIRVEGTVNMYGGKITGGQTTDDHGGNFSVSSATVNLYGGTVEGGRTYGSGRGGNFYLTGSTTQLNIYGGTVTGGISAGYGGNIFAYAGSAVTIYDGTVEKGVGETGNGHDIYVIGSKDNKYSTLEIYGGTVGSDPKSLIQYSEDNIIRIYNGVLSQDPTAFLADCACVNQSGDTYTVWNYGHWDEACDENCPFEKNIALVKPHTGTHSYRATQITNTCICAVCGKQYRSAQAKAVSEHGIYNSLSDAVAAGGDIWLLDDVAEESVLLDGITLDLNGHTLTADTLSATTGNVVDSTGGQGSLVSQSVALSGSNQALPLTTGQGLRFSALTPDVTLERLTEDSVRVLFAFTEKAAETVIDDLVLAGNEDLSVQFHLTWTKDGAKKTKTYVCDPALLTKYAQKWDGRRYTATITGVDAVEDLTCTVKIVSSAASGVTVSATKLNNVAYINRKLSWDAINSFPYKTENMTVAEMRQYSVDFFEYSKTFLWTPDESVDYIRNDNGTKDTMSQGIVYGGMPYVGSASGSPYRMMDYINPETGLVDMKKALPSLANGGVLTMEDLLYFGSQCAKTAGLGWGRVINSADYRATMYLTPANGVILLGDVVMDESKVNWSANYRTTQVCKENGEQVMFEAYGQLKKADGMVQYTTAGHVVMAYSDAVVVRNEDGTINGDESYVHIIHQAQKWSDQENELGDQYQMKNSVNSKMTFSSLYSGSYIPFTFAEFLGEDPVEVTTLNVTSGDTTLISGVVRESDRVFVAETTTEDMTFSGLCGVTINSNYNIADAYIIVYNERGQELYKHAVRSTTANTSLKMAASGERVAFWEYGKITAGQTYHAELVVQLITGERPTVWSGQLTMNS